MLVLGLDTETSSKDSKTANIWELGAALFDVSSDGVWRFQEGFSLLINEQGYYPLDENASKVNGITEANLKKSDINFTTAMQALANISSMAEYVIAHNAEYDMQCIENQCQRWVLRNPLEGKKVLCSYKDIDHKARGATSFRLGHLAQDYGLIVDPQDLHGAFGDVMLMAKVLNKLRISASSLDAYKQIPTAIIATPVVPPWEDNKVDVELAKKAGYSWEKTRATEKTYAKQWVKAVKQTELEQETREYKVIEVLQ